MEILCFLLSDKVIFLLFEIAFFFLFFYAVLRERGWFVRKTGAVVSVKRGRESWDNFNLAFGITSVVFMQVINSTKAFDGYKTLISLINLAMLLYLAFFNGWFRNKVMGIIMQSQQKEEKF